MQYLYLYISFQDPRAIQLAPRPAIQDPRDTKKRYMARGRGCRVCCVFVAKSTQQEGATSNKEEEEQGRGPNTEHGPYMGTERRTSRSLDSLSESGSLLSLVACLMSCRLSLRSAPFSHFHFILQSLLDVQSHSQQFPLCFEYTFLK